MTPRSLSMIAAAMHGATWAIRPETLEEFRALVRQERGGESRAPELSEPSEVTDRVTVRDGVATVAITGPMFRYANLMTAYCGASSYAEIQHALLTAKATPGLKAMVLAIDSPGGECKGLLDTAEMIYSMRGTVPIIAHVDGQACSAGLLLAAAADRVFLDPAAAFGCAGAIIGFDRVDEEADAVRTIYFVSDLSPRKNASVLEADGASQIKAMINDTGRAYFAALARFRGLEVTTVHHTYGDGAVFGASDALAREMADGIMVAEALSTQLGSSEGLARMQALVARQGTPAAGASSQGKSMADTVPQDQPQEPTAMFAAGAAVRSTVTRDVTVAENDEGTVVEVLEGTTVYAVEFAGGTYNYMTEAELAAANGGETPAARARVRTALAAAREQRAVKRVADISALAGRVSAEAITAAIADPTQTAASVALAHVLAGKAVGNPLQALALDAAGTPATPGTGSDTPATPTPFAAAKARADRINQRRAVSAGRTTTGAAR
jgi:capsid assembly protease